MPFKQCRLLNYLEPRLGYSQGKVFGIAKWRNEILAKGKIYSRSMNFFSNLFKEIF